MTEMVLKHLESCRMKVGEDEHKRIKTDKLMVTKTCHPF